MITVRLNVHYVDRLNDNGRNKVEKWGEWDVVAFPRIGEAMQVYFDGQFQLVIVHGITHFGVERPLPPSDSALQAKEPTATIHATWNSWVQGMCNHFQNIPGAEKFLPTWREFIGLDVPAELPLFANDMWPKRQGLILRVDEGSLKSDAMMWGVPCVVPGKRPGSKITKHVTNVRNLASPFWRSMLKDPARRCLVPFTAFAEPVLGGGRAEHWFTIRNRPLAAFAGIWRPTEEGNAFAFLTCEPNPLVAPLHPKAMPVILPEADYRPWLTGNWDESQALACPYPSQLMEVESPR